MLKKLNEILNFMCAWIPSVAKPAEKLTFKAKLLLTSLTLMIFFMLSNIPIFGILQTNAFDPFHLFRMVLASSHGTLMHLGISPIFLSSLVTQFLIQIKVLQIDTEKDQHLLKSMKKVIGMFLTYGQAITLVFSGTFGSPYQIGLLYSILIVVQLVAVCLIVLYLDEMLENYGLGSAISLFMATNNCEQVMWKCFSPTLVKSGSRWEFEGSMNAIVHLLANRPDKWQALYQAFFRQNLPNLFGFLVTIAFFTLIIYLQQMQVNLPLESLRVPGQTNSLPIKLLYTSATPIFLLSQIITAFEILTKSLVHNYPNSYLTDFFRLISYYLNAPQTLRQIFDDPIQVILYFVFVISSCAYLAHVEVNGLEKRATKVAKMLQEKELVLKIRSSPDGSQMYHDLKRYIDTATIFSGVLIGSLSVMAELMGSYLSASSVLLTCIIINEYVAKFLKRDDSENYV